MNEYYVTLKKYNTYDPHSSARIQILSKITLFIFYSLAFLKILRFLIKNFIRKT